MQSKYGCSCCNQANFFNTIAVSCLANLPNVALLDIWTCQSEASTDEETKRNDVIKTNSLFCFLFRVWHDANPSFRQYTLRKKRQVFFVSQKEKRKTIQQNDSVQCAAMQARGCQRAQGGTIVQCSKAANQRNGHQCVHEERAATLRCGPSSSFACMRNVGAHRVAQCATVTSRRLAHPPHPPTHSVGVPLCCVVSPGSTGKRQHHVIA